MRVLMLGWEFPPHISGGLGTACHGITKGLAHHGVDLLFVVPREYGDEDERYARIVGCNRLPVRSRNKPRLHWLHVPSPLRPYQNLTSYREHLDAEFPTQIAGGYGADLHEEVVRYAEAMLELALSEPFDVIHAHDWMTYPAGLALKQLSGKPLVCHVHSCEIDRNVLAPDANIEAIEQEGLSGADRTVCVSRFTASRIHDRYRVDPNRMRVVHNAVELLREPAPAKAGGRKVVSFLGRITHQKGPEIFLTAAAQVLARDPEVAFVMAGDGDLRRSMMARAESLGIAERVEFPGFLSGEEVDRLFARSDLFVMPSVSEPFGIASLEAVAAGVPVIVSRQSGVSEVLRHSVTFDHWDADALTTKILTLLASPRLRQELVRGAQEELDSLRWEESAQKLLNIYGELCA